jgi:hypothetical protein
MSITRCRECGGDVSSEAVVCPHCGIRDPAAAVAPAGAGARVQERDRAAGVHPNPQAHPIVRRRGGRAGWMVALLLLLVLAALFGLWYGNIVDFN